MAETEPPEPPPPPHAKPDAPEKMAGAGCTCIICGRSLHGVSYSGDCPNCRTPASLSLKNWQAQPPHAVESPPLGTAGGRVREDTLCGRCAFNLRGFPISGPCPQCRTPIASSLMGAERLGAAVPEDRPCVMCGYSLQGLPYEGNCPECGTPVERSLRGPLLRYSAPQYLATLHRGLVYAEVGTALKIVVSVGMVFVIYGRTTIVQQTLAQALQLVVIAAMLIGWWMFTSPDPAEAGDAPGNGGRRWLRIMIVIMAGVETLMAAFSYLPVFRTAVVASAGGGGQGAWLVYMLVRGFVVGIVSLIGVVALGSYLKDLSRRVPDRTLQRRAELYRWLIPLLLGLGIPGMFCCPTFLFRIGAIVLFFVLIEPWRWTLRTARRQQAAESAGGPPAGPAGSGTMG